MEGLEIPAISPVSHIVTFFSDVWPCPVVQGVGLNA